MPTIFFNTAWMDHYRGATDDDQPLDGGSWEEKHEVCNFLPVAGKCYGFVQPAGETIALERIGADASAEYLDGVTVVWSARARSGRTVVVGFYKNARIFRHRQKLPSSTVHEANKLSSYFAVCSEEDSILLPYKRRDHRIPRGVEAMGQSLIWYGDTARGTQEAVKVAELLTRLEANKAEALADAELVEANGSTAAIFDENQQMLEEDVSEVLSSDLTPTEKVALIRARIGQGKFRQQVMRMWRNGCAVTGCGIGSILRASHIKAWRDCANKQERLDPDNGLMLSANLDALFDRGLISFSDSGRIIVSEEISAIDQNKLGLGGGLVIRPNQGQIRYLKHHRHMNGFS